MKTNNQNITSINVIEYPQLKAPEPEIKPHHFDHGSLPYNEEEEVNEPSTDFPYEKIGDESFIFHGNNMDVMKQLADNSVDAVITDPPYGIMIIGKKWDDAVPNIQLWKEVNRILKPGGKIVAFGSPKTFHRIITYMEDAGLISKGLMMWVYASGFPKSHNLALSIDKHFGYPNRGHRIACASRIHPDGNIEPNGEKIEKYIPITEDAQIWNGWGTATKPAYEPIIYASKSLSENNVASNVLKWSTGGINIDACRVKNEYNHNKEGAENNNSAEQIGRFPTDIYIQCNCVEIVEDVRIKKNKKGLNKTVRHTNPNCPCYQLDQQSGTTSQGHWARTRTTGYGEFGGGKSEYLGVGEKDSISGGASRFFKIIYCKKASKKDKEEGLSENIIGLSERKNSHPTVKPTELMQELIRLVTPIGGLILDPFFGSGSTGKACLREGNYSFIGIELEKEHYETAIKRCKHEYEQSEKRNNITN
jgi:site-specific DNA-methyltransferase (adenine-specific)